MTACNTVNLGRNIARFMRSQVYIHTGQFCRLACTAERSVLTEFRQVLLQLASGYLQRGPNRPGSDRIDTDTILGDLLGQSTGKISDGPFCSRIIEQ